MRRFRTLAVFGVLLGLTLYFGGMLTYKLMSGSVLSTNHKTSLTGPGANAHTDSIGIEGRALIQVYRADGSLRSTWKGHNTLTAVGKNAIAVCASGLSTTPHGLNSCTGWTQFIGVVFSSSSQEVTAGGLATNVGTPSGCFTGSGLCSGWVATGGETVAPFSGTVTGVKGGFFDTPFDVISVTPPIPVNQGDRVVATITFTVS